MPGREGGSGNGAVPLPAEGWVETADVPLRRRRGPRWGPVRILSIVAVLALLALTVSRFNAGRSTIAEPVAPLHSDVCAAGDCDILSTSAAVLNNVREALGQQYVVDGTRLRDSRLVAREISIVASDGLRAVTIRGARVARIPTRWLAKATGEVTYQGDVEAMTIRGTVKSEDGRAIWVLEINAVGIGFSPRLFAAVRLLATDRRLIA